MQSAFSSTLFLTILLAIGLGFFLRAASKDRTTIVDVQSPLPPLEVLKGISFWLEERGWKKNGGNVEEKLLIFSGNVASSAFLVIFLSCLGGVGSACLGLVLIQFGGDLSQYNCFSFFGFQFRTPAVALERAIAILAQALNPGCC